MCNYRSFPVFFRCFYGITITALCTNFKRFFLHICNMHNFCKYRIFELILSFFHSIFLPDTDSALPRPTRLHRSGFPQFYLYTSLFRASDILPLSSLHRQMYFIGTHLMSEKRRFGRCGTKKYRSRLYFCIHSIDKKDRFHI